MGAFDITNPAACGFTDLGVTKGICWCKDVGQTICDSLMGTGSYAAAIASQAPDVAYPPPLVPARPTGPATAPQETQPGTWTPDQAISEADAQTQQQNLNFFKQIAANLDQLGGGKTPNPTGLSITSLIALGLAAGAVLLLVTSGGRGRR